MLAAWTRPLRDALVPWDRPGPRASFGAQGAATGRAGVEEAVDEIVALLSSVRWAVAGAIVSDGRVAVVARPRWRWSTGLVLASFPAADPPDPESLRAGVARLGRTSLFDDLRAGWTALGAAAEGLAPDDCGDPLRAPRLVLVPAERRRLLRAVLDGAQGVRVVGAVPRGRRVPTGLVAGRVAGVGLAGRVAERVGARVVVEARITWTAWGGGGPSPLRGQVW